MSSELRGPLTHREAKKYVQAATELGLCPRGAAQNLLCLLLEECDRIGRVEGWSLKQLAVECRVTRQTITKALKRLGEAPSYLVMTRLGKVRSRSVPEFRIHMNALAHALRYQRQRAAEERADRRSVKKINTRAGS